MIPIRCMTCGTPVAQYWDAFNEKVGKGADPRKVLDSLGIGKYCCRALFLSHVDMIEKVGKFKK